MTERFGHLYGPAALLGFAMTFAPLYADRTEIFDNGSHLTVSYRSMWHMLSGHGGGIAGFGLLVVGVLVALCLWATLTPPRTAVVPVAIAGVSLLTFVLLATKTGASSNASLSTSGAIGLGMTLFLTAIAATHAALLVAQERSTAAPLA